MNESRVDAKKKKVAGICYRISGVFFVLAYFEAFEKTKGDMDLGIKLVLFAIIIFTGFLSLFIGLYFSGFQKWRRITGIVLLLAALFSTFTFPMMYKENRVPNSYYAGAGCILFFALTGGILLLLSKKKEMAQDGQFPISGDSSTQSPISILWYVSEPKQKGKRDTFRVRFIDRGTLSITSKEFNFCGEKGSLQFDKKNVLNIYPAKNKYLRKIIIAGVVLAAFYPLYLKAGVSPYVLVYTIVFVLGFVLLMGQLQSPWIVLEFKQPDNTVRTIYFSGRSGIGFSGSGFLPGNRRLLETIKSQL